MNIYLRIMIVCLISFALPVQAEQPRLPIDPFDGAELVDYLHRDNARYTLALGPYKKRDNRWRPDVFKRIQGALIRETYELPRGTDEREVFDFYRGQMAAVGTLQPETLYECSRRRCGDSNTWANDHFRIKQLYGLDQYQFYGVYQWNRGVVSLYVVRRGNRRVYVQLDHLAPEKTELKKIELKK